MDINTIINISATGGGVSGSDSAAIVATITAEAEHKGQDDGLGCDYSPPEGRLGTSKAQKYKTNHTTINQDAGGGMRGWLRLRK
eukprot:scaffold25888_cov49-Cyclotella_meneghiniana.AAC.1